MRLRPFVTLVLLAAAGVANAANLNVITEVSVRDDGGFVVLTVKGSKAPNFTTFSMADPPRFVIDLSEAKFQAVPEDVVVQDGVVNVVKNLSYGSDATSIARVMLAFAVDVDPPDVQTQGTALVVRVTRPASAGAPVAKADDGAAKAAEDAARAEAERKAQEDAARADAERKAKEDEAARAEAEKKAQEDAARAEAEKKAQDGAARADAEKKAQDGAARADADRKAQEDAARAEAEKKARDEEELRKAREAYEQERQAAVAKAEAERAAKAEAAAAASPAPREEPKPAEPQPAEPAPAIAEATPAAEAPPPPPAASETAPAPAAADRLAAAPSARVREIGFKQLPGATRVFVRTTVTPRFTVQELGENTIRVSLENTRATRRNDLRFLDTSFFRSAVAMVTPKKVGSGYVVDIRLRERVPFQQKIEGDMLALDFERPAAPAASAEPANADLVPAAVDPAAPAEAVPAALEGGAPAAQPAAN